MLQGFAAACKLRARQEEVMFLIWRFKPQNTKLPLWVQVSSPNLSATKSHHLEREEKITYLQDMQIIHQQCKLPVARVSHCLPTSHLAPGRIKKEKDKKDENKEWLKYSNREKGTFTLGGLLPCVPHKHTAETLPLQCWWGSIHPESIGKSSGFREVVPTKLGSFPLDEAHMGYPTLSVSVPFVPENLLYWIRS